MEHKPVEFFEKLFNEELSVCKARIPSACCLSTNGLDGFPNARFVSFKGILDDCFVFTGTLSSRKGLEINNSEKVALTFWWAESARQVRVQGIAKNVNNNCADSYFAERDVESQIVSIISNQGEVLHDPKELVNNYESISLAFKSKPLKRPDNWGGYSIEPIRIEFLAFKENRFHERMLYEKQGDSWELIILKP